MGSGDAAPVRPLRADAGRNRAQILAAARDRLIDAGPDVPLEDVARSAGVGIATLYRRFPDRPALLHAVALQALAQARAAAESAEAEVDDPMVALATYMHAVLDLRTSALIPVLLAVLPEPDRERSAHSAAAAAAVERIVQAAREAGTLRPDVTAADIGLLLVRLSRPLPGGLPAATQAAYGHRHLDLVLAGLTATAGPPLSGPQVGLDELRRARQSPPEPDHGSR